MKVGVGRMASLALRHFLAGGHPHGMCWRIVLACLALGLLGGCATAPEGAGVGPKRSTVLGMVTVEEKSFVPAAETTLALSEGEISANNERTGRKVSLLWGLITYTDY